MPPKIPDRWIPYKACGDVIEGTRIICFKVPLHKNVQTDPDITEIWDIPAVLAEIPKLGAVIDLTNTGRYYNPSEFEEAGVSHRKILMPGREIPSEDKVLQFMDAVDEFLGKDCDSLVGVHCTHGLNRTGYMVCRYMRDRLNIPAEEAIKKFEKARGYEIEREIYLASLLDRDLPRPDFGKETVIKAINKENNVYSFKHDYRHDRRSHPYDSNNRYSNGRYGDRHGSSNKYGNERNDSRHYFDKNNGNRREDNGYLSWRKRDGDSCHNSQGSRKIYKTDNTDDSDRSTPERSGYSYKHDY